MSGFRERMRLELEDVDRHLGPARWPELACWGVGLVAILGTIVAVRDLVTVVTIPPLPTSAGVWVYRIEPHLRAAVLGILLVSFVARLRPSSEGGPGELSGRSALALSDWSGERFRDACGRWAPEVAWLLLLMAYRDVMRAEIYEHAYGEGQFQGTVHLKDCFGPATFALLVAWAVAALGRIGAREPTIEPALASRWLRWFGLGLLVYAMPSFKRFVEASGSDVLGDTFTVVVSAWQALVLGLLLVSAERPRASVASALAWLERHAGPMALLVALEALRVTSRADWYRERYWLAPRAMPLPEVLSVFEGRVHDRIGIEISALVLLAALIVWLRPGSTAVQRAGE